MIKVGDAPAALLPHEKKQVGGGTWRRGGDPVKGEHSMAEELREVCSVSGRQVVQAFDGGWERGYGGEQRCKPLTEGGREGKGGEQRCKPLMVGGRAEVPAFGGREGRGESRGALGKAEVWTVMGHERVKLVGQWGATG